MKSQNDDHEVVTKGFLRSVLAPYPKKIQVEMMLEASAHRADEKARGYRDDILTRLDSVMGELLQIREERLFEKHEVKMLEKKVHALESKH